MILLYTVSFKLIFLANNFYINFSGLWIHKPALFLPLFDWSVDAHVIPAVHNHSTYRPHVCMASNHETLLWPYPLNRCFVAL